MLTADENIVDLRQVNPLTLAFIGDGVYELMVREEIVKKYQSLSAGRLHKLTVQMVKASAQDKAYCSIKHLLSETELSIYKRGRNANGVSPPRGSNAAQYRSATGLEALFGWLHLSCEGERIRYLFNAILDGVSNEADFDCLDIREKAEVLN